MKKVLSALLIMLTFIANTINVDAALVAGNNNNIAINTSACQNGYVYTNYYLLLEANTTEYLTSTGNKTTSNRALFENNSYRVTFDENNVASGQVQVNKNISKNENDIDTMSLDEFYEMFLKAAKNGTNKYQDGRDTYFTKTAWLHYENGTWVSKYSGLDVTTYGASYLKSATVNATSTVSNVSYINNSSDLTLQVTRNYSSTIPSQYPLQLMGSDGQYHNWHLNPQVYYIQYCQDGYNNNYGSGGGSSNSYYDYINYNDNVSNETIDVPGRQRFERNQYNMISYETPYRNGYRFLYWNTNRNGYGETYYPGDRIYNNEYEDITLYAIWEEDYDSYPNYNNNNNNTYTITYRPNTSSSVTNMPSTITINSNENTYISSLTPVRSGYEFLGWSTDSNAETADSRFSSGALYSNRSDLILYAVWTKVGNNVALPENPETGIIDYLLPLGGTAGLSGAGLTLLKRKKSFKQF